MGIRDRGDGEAFAVVDDFVEVAVGAAFEFVAAAMEAIGLEHPAVEGL